MPQTISFNDKCVQFEPHTEGSYDDYMGMCCHDISHAISTSLGSSIDTFPEHLWKGLKGLRTTLEDSLLQVINVEEIVDASDVVARLPLSTYRVSSSIIHHQFSVGAPTFDFEVQSWVRDVGKGMEEESLPTVLVRIKTRLLEGGRSKKYEVSNVAVSVSLL
jgi:hypothetical protein